MNLSISVLLLFAVYWSHSTANILVKRDANSCAKRIPFADTFEYGYDLTEYDIFGCPVIGGRKAKILDLNNCGAKKKFVFADNAKSEYDVPDAFADTVISPFGFVRPARVYSSFKQLKDAFLKETIHRNFQEKIDGIGRYKLINSQMYNDLQSLFLANEKSIVLKAKALSSYRTRIANEELKNFLNAEFKKDMEALPAKFEGNEHNFLTLLDKFGTHIFRSAEFGGITYRMGVLSKAELDAGKDEDLKWEITKGGYTLSGELNVLCDESSGSRKVAKVHSKAHNFTQVMLGGYANLNKLKSGVEVDTDYIASKPALIASEIIPISTLFEGEKKENVVKALKVYLLKRSISSKRIDCLRLYNPNIKRITKVDEALAKADETTAVVNEEELRKVESDLNAVIEDLKRAPANKPALQSLFENIAVKAQN